MAHVLPLGLEAFASTGGGLGLFSDLGLAGAMPITVNNHRRSESGDLLWDYNLTTGTTELQLKSHIGLNCILYCSAIGAYPSIIDLG